MSKMKIVFLAVCMIFLFHNKVAFASNEYLYVRAVVGGDYEVVAQGTREDHCQTVITDTPPSVIINGFEIQITTSSWTPLPCVIPINPPITYSVVAPLGRLIPGQYLITWSQSGFYTGSVQLNVAASNPVSIPTLSPVALISLICLFLCIVRHITNRSKTKAALRASEIDVKFR